MFVCEPDVCAVVCDLRLCLCVKPMYVQLGVICVCVLCETDVCAVVCDLRMCLCVKPTSSSA